MIPWCTLTRWSHGVLCGKKLAKSYNRVSSSDAKTLGYFPGYHSKQKQPTNVEIEPSVDPPRCTERIWRNKNELKLKPRKTKFCKKRTGDGRRKRPNTVMRMHV